MANAFSKLIRSARVLGRDERGFALPTVILLSVTILAVGGATTMISIKAQGGVTRDSGTKSALAVAESGVAQAILHFNRGSAPCSAAAGVWCGPVAGSAVNGGAISYWVRSDISSGAGCGDFLPLEVVSTGTFNGVTRRVYETLCSASGQAVFSTFGVKTTEDIQLDSESVIHTATATNGSMTLNSNAKLCGQGSVGIGEQLELLSNAGYFLDNECSVANSTVLQQPLVLPPVNQGDAATNNDNSRLFSLDVVSGNKSNTCFNGVRANGLPGTCGSRQLTIGTGTTVTLSGSTYSFCKLSLSQNSSLRVAPGANVTIFFDSPEACGFSAATEQVLLEQNSRITPENLTPSSMALLFVGSEAIPTSMRLRSNTYTDGPCDLNFIVYAPLTDVEMDSNSHFCGALAAKSLHLDQNATIRLGSGSGTFVLPNTPPHYIESRFLECSAASAPPADPTLGC